MNPKENTLQADDRMRALRRVHYVSSNYTAMQGLRLIPFGLLCILLTALPILQPGGRVGAILPLLLLPTACILVWSLQWAIGHYYQRRFGQTLPRQWVGWRVNLVLWTILLGFFVVLAIDIALNVFLLIPMSTLGLFLGAIGLGIYWPRREFALHWVLLSLTVALAGVLPLLVGYDPRGYPTIISGQLALLAFGISLIVGGLLDHRILMDTLGPLPEDSHGEAV